MPDNKRTLPESLGTPLAWITDSNDKPILMENEYGQLVNMNQFVENFKYRYDEENDDECTIRLKVIKAQQLNNPNFKTDTVIHVQWGYVLPRGVLLKSKKRKVAIRDTKKSYRAETIQMDIICSDLVSYLKNIKINTVSDKDNFEEWLKEIVRGEYVATRTIKGKTKVIAKKNKDFGGKELDQFKPKAEFQKELLEEVEFDPDTQEVVKTIKGQKAAIGHNEYLVIKKKDQVIKGKSKAIYQAIKEKLEVDPNGPAHLETRDNVINILSRNFDQAPYARYTYSGGSGEVIEFRPETNVVKTSEDNAESNHINPKTKKVETLKLATATDHNEVPEGLTRLDLAKMWVELKAIYAHNIDNPLNQIPVDDITFKKVVKTLGQNASTTNIDNTTRVYFKPPMYETFKTYSAKTILQSPFFESIRREAILNNYIKKKVERKYEANMKVIGDPSLITSRVYDIRGVAKEDEGNWYATVCEHEIDTNSGYTCQVNLIKKPKLIATLLERREYDKDNPSGTSKVEYTEDKQEFPELNTNSSNIGSINEVDILDRLSQQELAENFYQNDNDIPFPTKQGINNVTTEPNSQIS